jgi:hypothetical protein
MRVVCISDTHGRHDALQVPDGDLLLHAGDCSKLGTREQIEAFDRWLGTLPHRHKVVIAGNHDFGFEQEPGARAWITHATYLQDEPLVIDLEPNGPEDSARNLASVGAVEVVRTAARFAGRSGAGGGTHEPNGPEDSARNLAAPAPGDSSDRTRFAGRSGAGGGKHSLRLWGSPWQPRFFDWAFNLDRGEPLRRVWEKIPPQTDILLTHGPPYGILDATFRGQLVGCEELLEAVARVRPRLHVFGHIHEAHGVKEHRWDDGRTTVFVNASSCALSHWPAHPPVVIDL